MLKNLRIAELYLQPLEQTQFSDHSFLQYFQSTYQFRHCIPENFVFKTFIISNFKKIKDITNLIQFLN